MAEAVCICADMGAQVARKNNFRECGGLVKFKCPAHGTVEIDTRDAPDMPSVPSFTPHRLPPPRIPRRPRMMGA